MINIFGNTIWLCLIISLLVPFAHGNTGGNGDGASSGFKGTGLPNDGRHGSFGKHGGHNPDKFGQGFHPQQTQASVDGQQGNGQQDNPPEVSGQIQQYQSVEPGQKTAPSSAVAALPALPMMTISSVAVAPLVIPIQTSTSPVFVQPYSIVEAAGELYPSPPAILGPEPSSEPSINSVITPISASPTLDAATIAQPSSTITRTVSMTVTVPASSGYGISQTIPSSTITTSAVPALDLTPISPSLGTMSAAAKAGMGIGVTFGILSLASVVGLGFYLWRRRRNARQLAISDEDDSPRRGGLGGLFSLSKWKRATKKEKADAGWSIESASQVEIVRGANTRTVSRGSNTTTPPVPDFKSMFPPADTDLSGEQRGRSTPPLRLKNLALTSNPPSLPRLPEFPSPPDSGRSLGGQRETKTNSWPLED